MECEDCFFQSGRSYLEPLEKNLPNIPTLEMAEDRVVWVNDGNDSNNQRELVLEATKQYKDKFYHTSIPKDIGGFNAPVVLTLNPAKMTDIKAELLDSVPENLMFVRARVNTWNLDLVDNVVKYYSEREIPIILTFMRYYTGKIPKVHEVNYAARESVLNVYRKIIPVVWKNIMARYECNKWIYSCGREDVEKGFLCRHCGNCLREYFATMERLGVRK